LPGTTLEIITTHLGLRRRERAMQVSSLLGPQWLNSPDLRDKPTILLGDLNAVPSSMAYRTLARDFHSSPSKGAPTFPSRFALLKLDHVMTRNGPRIVSQEVPQRLPFRTASDHLPLVAHVDIDASQGSSIVPVALGGV
jgi:endonuclease/exonuclease/phosphatase family metal-dependent hydrolase